MSSKRFMPGTTENGIFNDFYKIAQDYYVPEDNRQYWDNVLIALKLFMKKYNNDPFATELSFALWNTLYHKKGKCPAGETVHQEFLDFCEQRVKETGVIENNENANK